MCDRVTSLYSRKLSEHYKPAIMEKIIIKKKKTIPVVYRGESIAPHPVPLWHACHNQCTNIDMLQLTKAHSSLRFLTFHLCPFAFLDPLEGQ